VASKASFTIYPNPASTFSQLVYSLEEPAQIAVSIYDLKGSIVYSTQHNARSGEHRVDLPVNDLPQGVYLLRLVLDGANALETKLLIR